MDDFIGQKFGRLTPIQYDGYDKTGHRRVICQCECGTIKTMLKQSIVSGAVVSCGCYQQEMKSLPHEQTRKYNDYDLDSQEYGIGYAHNTGTPFYFDKSDYNKIKHYCWREGNNGYIITNRDKKLLCLHRVVTNASDGMDVDHINHILTDNRKSNLRVVTRCTNLHNLKISKNNTSGCTGVFKNKNKHIESWSAYIRVNNRRKYLGTYYTYEDAVNARRLGEILYYDEILPEQYTPQQLQLRRLLFYIKRCKNYTKEDMFA